MTATYEPDDSENLAENWLRCRTSDGQNIFYQHKIHRKKQTERPPNTEEQAASDKKLINEGTAFWGPWVSEVKPNGDRTYFNMRTKEMSDDQPEGFCFTEIMIKGDAERKTALLFENYKFSSQFDGENSICEEKPGEICSDEEEQKRHDDFVSEKFHWFIF